jgi:hypothetical protein
MGWEFSWGRRGDRGGIDRWVLQPPCRDAIYRVSTIGRAMTRYRLGHAPIPVGPCPHADGGISWSGYLGKSAEFTGRHRTPRSPTPDHPPDSRHPASTRTHLLKSSFFINRVADTRPPRLWFGQWDDPQSNSKFQTPNPELPPAHIPTLRISEQRQLAPNQFEATLQIDGGAATLPPCKTPSTSTRKRGWNGTSNSGCGDRF